MKINEAFILRNIYGKNILMPVHSNEISNDPILLNEVAAFIWNAALNKQEKGRIIDDVAQEYSLKEKSSELIAVEQFIDQMITMGLFIIS